MLATVGWGRRGFSEIKLFSRDDNDDNNNNDEEEEKLSYAETKSSISNNNESGEKGEKNSKSYSSSFSSSSSEINCIEWSKSNGNCVACGTSDGRVVVLDKELTFIGEVKEEEGEKRRRRRIGAISSSLTNTGSLKEEEEDAMNDYDEFEVKSMDFHSSSRYLAVGGTSGVVNVWDLKTRRVSRRLDASARNNGDTAAGIVVNAVKFNRDDRVIACGTEQGEIVLHKGGERFDEEEEEKSEADRWCCSSEPPLSAFDVNESTSVNCLDFSPHRRMMLAAGTSGGDLNVYDCESESLETRFRSSDANNIIRSIAFSPTAPRIIAVANDDGSVSLRDVAMHPKTGVCLHIPNPNKRWMHSSSKNGVIFGTAGAASSVSWHPSGQALAVGYRGNGVVAMYDCRSLRSHMDERNNNNSNDKYGRRRTTGSNNDRFDSSGSEEYPRALFETEAHEGGRVIALKWQPPVAKTTKTKKTTSSNANAYYDGGSDKENKIENNIEQKQQKKKKAHPKEAQEDATEAMRKSLENLNAKTTTTTTATQQQQMMITADAISDEVCKKTKEVVKVCLEKEVKSLRADVRNLHVELLRAQEENASMFRKLHEQQLELMDALNSSSHNKINGKTDTKY